MRSPDSDPLSSLRSTSLQSDLTSLGGVLFSLLWTLLLAGVLQVRAGGADDSYRCVQVALTSPLSRGYVCMYVVCGLLSRLEQ